MRKSYHLAMLSLSIPLLSHRVVSAQERSPTFGAFRLNFAIMDTQRDDLRDGMGYQVSGYVGRSLAPDFAAIGEAAVTTVSRQGLYCLATFPGCTTSPPGNETGLAFATGIQWYTARGARKAAFTLTPGVVWFVNRAAGTRAVAPKVGGRVDVGWLLPEGPRLGLSLGAEWWGANGNMPRWVIPLGFTLGVR